MRTFVTSLLSLCLLLAASATAFAQDGPGARNPSPDVSYDFEDENVQGDRDVNQGEFVPGRTRRMRTTLVRPRVHFVPEMLKSVENL